MTESQRDTCTLKSHLITLFYVIFSFLCQTLVKQPGVINYPIKCPEELPCVHDKSDGLLDCLVGGANSKELGF